MKTISLFFGLLITGILFSQPYNNDGDTLFASSFIHEIRFNFYHPAYYDSLMLSHTTDTYYVCDMVFDGVTFPTVGVKFKGNSSFNILSQKKSMKVDLDYIIPSQDLDDLNKFNLNNLYHDPTCLREKLMADFLNRNQLPGPRVTYAKVYYNNVYWGLYTLVEEVNKDFLDGWFNDKRGNLFKGDPSGDLKWINSSPSSYYNKYELHTNETQNDWSDLVEYLDKINNYSLSGIRDTLDRYMDVPGFLKYEALCDIFVSLDSYIGSRHNYFVYHDSITDRFRWVFWDINSCFGVFNQSMSVAQMEGLSMTYLGTPPQDRPLAWRLMQDPLTLQELSYWFCVFLQEDQFSNTALDPRIDSLSDRIRNDVYSDPNYTYTNQQFEDNRTIVVAADNKNYPGLKPFIGARRDTLTSQLAAYGCYLGTSSEGNPALLKLYPNPAHDGVTIIYPDGLNEEMIPQLFDLTGQCVREFAKVQAGEQKIQIPVSGIRPGVYLLRMGGARGTVPLRLVIF
ncbi:MAG: CotH kinase family protein [Bacteroidia bacterium]|nr:CotH kinase family protein [Bacteroidia bacterium]